SPVASWEKFPSIPRILWFNYNLGSSFSGVKAEDSWLSQPQRSVSVRIGDILHLKCQVFDNFTPGPVKWLLVEEPQWKLIYQDIQTDEVDERITRDYPNSNTDFTISIHNVTLEDAGTYCCVKEKRGLRGSEVLLGGSGTCVVVECECEQMVG
uniref:Ig-like domain-containing protein n=1 Tax=Laticauda laticaudata TaxID=8630 RepID=A0A8C5WRM8_LATLA